MITSLLAGGNGVHLGERERDPYLRGPLSLGLGPVECRHPIIHGLLL